MFFGFVSFACLMFHSSGVFDSCYFLCLLGNKSLFPFFLFACPREYLYFLFPLQKNPSSASGQDPQRKAEPSRTFGMMRNNPSVGHFPSQIGGKRLNFILHFPDR